MSQLSKSDSWVSNPQYGSHRALNIIPLRPFACVGNFFWVVVEGFSILSFFFAVFKCYFAQVCCGGGRNGGEDLHVDLVHHGQLPWRICSHCVSLSLCNHRYNHRYNHHKKQLSGRTCSHKFESVLTSWFIGIITSIGMPWYMTILDDQSLGLKSASGHVYHVDTLSRLPIMCGVLTKLSRLESQRHHHFHSEGQDIYLFRLQLGAYMS